MPVNSVCPLILKLVQFLLQLFSLMNQCLIVVAIMYLIAWVHLGYVLYPKMLGPPS